MVDALLQSPVQWLDGTGPHAEIVVSTHCQLTRNLADYPFVSQCSDDVRELLEKRILDAMDSINLSAGGSYFSFSEVDDVQAHFLLERRLIPTQLIQSTGARGVHVDTDQQLSVAINGSDHLTIFVHASGHQIHELGARLNQIDDALVGLIDFTFDDRRGYLTSSLAEVGTGLRASAVLHLPALTMTDGLEEFRETLKAEKIALAPWLGTGGGSTGELYELSNAATLGLSESEIIYRVAQRVDELVEAEREAQTRVTNEFRVQLEDRVNRALALARSARLLAFDECVEVLSSLRLGVSTGLLDSLSMRLLNETLMASQLAHLELDSGQPSDETRSDTLRAELFRGKFAENETV